MNEQTSKRQTAGSCLVSESRQRTCRKHTQNYSFGFNGQLTDTEWNGGQSVNFLFRVHDPRLGRFLSVDPLAPSYPWYTPYQFAGNMPIWAVDVEGAEPAPTTEDPVSVEGDKSMRQEEQLGGCDNCDDVINSAEFDGEVYTVYAEELTYGEYIERTQGIKGQGGNDRTYIEFSTYESNFETHKYTTEGNEQVRRDGYKMHGMVDVALGAEGVLSFKNLLKPTSSSLKTGSKFLKNNPFGCFTATTIVKTQEGDKAIEDILIGDLIWAYDDSTGMIALKEVIKLHRYKREAIYKIYANNNIIETTSDHPFYVDSIYIEAKHLQPKNQLLSKSGITIEIDSIVIIEGERDVYNFTVNDFHTYFVGIDGILVHNDPCDEIMKLKNTNPALFKERLQAFRWGDYLANTLNVIKPLSDVPLHAHHIVLKVGKGKAAFWAARSRAILESYKINPYFGKANLTWAPYKSVHGEAPQKAIYEALKAAFDKGVSEFGMKKVLRELGYKATNGTLY